MRGKIVNFFMGLLNLFIGATILVYIYKIPNEITELTVQEFNIVKILKIVVYVIIGITTFLNIIYYFLNSRNGTRKLGFLLAIFSISFIFIKEWPIAIFSILSSIIIMISTLKEQWVEANSITAISIIGIIIAVCVLSIFSCFIYKGLGAYILNKQNENELSYKSDYFRYVTELEITEPYINVKSNGKYGYITPSGNVVIDFEYDYASPFVPIVMYNKNFQFALVCKDGTSQIILKNKRKVLTYRSESMDEDFEAKLEEIQNIYYNTFKQTETMHFEIDTNFNNSYVALAYKDQNPSYTYRYNYNNDYDVIITQSNLGFGDTYELARKDNIDFRIKLECEHLAYDENYLYVYSNGNIPFYDVSSKKQGWFTRYGNKIVLTGKAQILEIVGDNVLIKNHNNNTVYFINNKDEIVSDIYKEIFICGQDIFLVKNSKNKYMVINSNFEKVFESEWDFVDTSLISIGLFVFGTSKDAISFNAYDYAENMNLKILDFNGNVVADGIEQCYNKFYYISNDTSKPYSERYSDFLNGLKTMNNSFFGDEFYK